MATPNRKPGYMTADEFLAWATVQQSGRYELLDGEIVAMAPERIAHNELKLDIAVRLRDAVRIARLDCQVFTDGLAVRVDDFRIPSVQHDLIFRTTNPAVIHHFRAGEGTEVRIVGAGPLRLDPPGITLQV